MISRVLIPWLAISVCLVYVKWTHGLIQTVIFHVSPTENANYYAWTNAEESASTKVPDYANIQRICTKGQWWFFYKNDGWQNDGNEVIAYGGNQCTNDKLSKYKSFRMCGDKNTDVTAMSLFAGKNYTGVSETVYRVAENLQTKNYQSFCIIGQGNYMIFEANDCSGDGKCANGTGTNMFFTRDSTKNPGLTKIGCVIRTPCSPS